MDVLSMIGRLHPMVLHLPIGIFVFVFFLEIFSRFKKTRKYKDAISMGLLMTAFFASVSCLTGWLLSDSVDYAGDLVWYHKWGAIAFTILSWTLYFIQSKVGVENKFYFSLLCSSMLALTYVGHQGASLTHGVDFLWAENTSGDLEVVDQDRLVVFENLIQPIIKKKCQSCHNIEKKKGKLDMSSHMAMMKGGESGPVLTAGVIAKSLMIKRIHLPLDDEEHMPPDNKKQLTEDEIRLLEWWIEQGASEKALFNDLERDESVDRIIEKYSLSKSTRPSVDRLDDDILNAIKAQGIPVSRLSEASPFVSVDLSRKSNLTNKQFKKLRKLEDQLIDLDLAFANVNDVNLKTIASLENVERLELQGTGITTEGLKSILNWKNLKVLNLYKTKVGNDFLNYADQFSSLHRLYLWQSNMTANGVDSLRKLLPLVEIQYGMDESMFGEARLLPPKIVADAELFADSLIVELDTNFKGVDIRYTLDGTDPDESSMKYEKAISLDNTSILKAICMKEGWEQSEVGTRQFIKATKRFVSAKLKRQPSQKYAARGAESLIDLVKGTQAFTDGDWLGFEGEGIEVVLDLGELRNLKELTVGALEATASYIFYPRGIQAFASANGLDYHSIVKEVYPESIKENQSLKNFVLNFPETEARYIKVKIDGQGFNPEWHPAPGAKSWLFVDEIVVN